LKVKYLTRKEITVELWDKAVAADPDGYPYAFSFYLDAVAPQWAGLVLGNYESVFPLPFNSKIPFFKQVYQPHFSQRLGVFGSSSQKCLISELINAIPKEFAKVHLKVSAYPEGSEWLVKKRLNMELDLNRPYLETYSGYSKSLAKKIRKGKKSLIVRESSDVNGLIQLYKNKQGKKISLHAQDYKRASLLFDSLLLNHFGKLLEVLNEEGEILCRGFFPITSSRIINLFSAATEKGREQAARPVMMDYLIESYSEQNYIFDFEGSELPGVYEFFKSFGPVDRYYYEIEKGQLPLPVRILKKFI
jgi:hypothetical protein